MTVLSQTKALLWKNLQSKRHKWVRTSLDVCLPILWMIILLWLWTSRENTRGETNLHLNSGTQLSHKQLLSDLVDSFRLVSQNGFNMPTIGITPPGPMADMLENYLIRSTASFEKDKRMDDRFFMRFSSEEGMVNFIRDKSYLFGKETRRIFMSVVIETDDLLYSSQNEYTDGQTGQSMERNGVKRIRVRPADVERLEMRSHAASLPPYHFGENPFYNNSNSNNSDNNNNSNNNDHPMFGAPISELPTSDLPSNIQDTKDSSKKNALLGYKLRANLTQVGIKHIPSTDDMSDPPMDPMTKGANIHFFQGFKDNGYHLIQSIIDEHALFLLGASPNDMRQLSADDYDQRIQIMAQPMPTLAFVDVSDIKLVLYLSILLVIDGYFYLFRTFVRGLVQERLMQQQFQAISVGLSTMPIILSACIVAFTQLTIIAAVVIPMLSLTFPKTNVWRTVLTYALFNCAFIAFGVCFSQLFKQSKVVTFCCFVLFFKTVLLSFLAQMGQEGSQHISCYNPMSALAMYIQTMVLYENSPARDLDLHVSVSLTHLCNFMIIIYLSIATVMYSILSYLLNRARKSYSGMQTIWMRLRYFLTCSKPHTVVNSDGTVKYSQFQNTDDTSTNSTIALPVDTKMTKIEQEYLSQCKIEQIRGLPAVEVVDVTVQKKRKHGYDIVLRSVNISIPENHITAIVGGENCGSAYLLGLIAGISQPSVGSIRLLGQCLSRVETRSDNIVGYCSSEDIVLPELTVWQHMELLALLKHQDKNDPEVMDHLHELLVQVGLGVGCEDDARDKLMTNLSGGQKRRVNVAMALIAKPKIIVLDNFTNGVDASSRQLLLQLLRTLKSDRVVIFTTNNYDDVTIADSIVVMEEGMVSSFGTPAYLRDKCGLGYTLLFTKTEASKKDNPDGMYGKQWMEQHGKVQAIIDQNAEVRSQLKYSSESRRELIYHIRSTEADFMPKVLELAEHIKEEMQFVDMSLYVRTFDDVIFGKSLVDDSTTSQDDENRDVLKELWDSVKKPTQIYDSASDKVIPLPRIDSSCANNGEEEEPNLYDHVYDYSFLTMIVYQFYSYVKIRFFSLIRKPNTFRNVFVWPLLLLTLTVLMVMPNGSVLSRKLGPSLYQGYPIEYAVGVGPSEDALSKTLTTFNGITAVPILADNYESRTIEGRQNMLLNSISEYVDTFPRVGGITIQEYNKSPFKLSAIVHYNTSAADSSLVFTSLLTNMRYNEYLKTNSMGVYMGAIEVENHPLPTTQLNFTTVSFLAVLTLVLFLALMLFPASAAKDVSRILQQIMNIERLSGMMIPVFWTSRYLVDVMFFQLNSIAATCLLKFAGLESYMDSASCFYRSCVSFAGAIFPMVYCLAFMFKTDNATQNAALAITCILTFMVLLPFVVLLLVDKSNLAVNVMYLGLWSPTFVFAMIFMTSNSSMPILHLPFTSNQFMVVLWAQAAFYFSLLLFLHYATQNNVWERILDKYWYKAKEELQGTELDSQYSTPAEVRTLQEDVATGAYDDPMKFPLVVKGLNKTYNHGKSYVQKDISFAVERGTVLGILGKNGCGKSTAIKAIVGGTAVELDSTHGYIRINGRRIDNGAWCANDIGYCPQFSSLYDYLTPEEHVEHYAVLRGMSNPFRQYFLDALLFELDLYYVKDKKVCQLEGGMKRKLSLAIALIGNPSLIIIDEQNVDQLTRKRIHQVIRKCAAERAVIFTSHLLDEVESICDKVLIMKGGHIKAMGTANELKEQHGNAYLLTIKIANGWEDLVVMTLRSHFYDIQIVEKTQNIMKFMIYKDQVASLLEVFTVMEEVKNTLTCSATGNTVHVIEEFNVGDPNFQQVFNAIVDEQEEKQESPN